MQSSKFVVKCGNFAVLVDLHILPLGSQDNASWFYPEHRKEVGSLIRYAVEQKVRQYQEARHLKIQPKPRKDLTLTSPLCLKGGNVHLAVHFLKRHVNLRCVVKQHYQELRVFPERVVVCASPPENAALPNVNQNLDVNEQSATSKSKYFTSPGESVDSLPSIAATKRAILQKIARQANIQPRQCQDDQGSRSAQPKVDATEKRSFEGHEGHRPVPLSSEGMFTDKSLEMACVQEEVKTVLSFELSNSNGSGSAQSCPNEDKPSEQLSTDQATALRRRQRTPSSSREDIDHQKAKRLRIGDAAVLSNSNRPSSSLTALGSTWSPRNAAQLEIRVEEEQLTNGNSTAVQTNQSRLAASLRGLSVKPGSSDCAISSRSATREERRGSAPKTSRLRRLKKS
ncbi:protein SLX4IP isoform X2 [Myxocyprinus asiaticus]|uniref:protein SLX4IP isoform X2 n=1 Tax=Myxocyprinus asiaticus TaxID=70543 RepID=UPI0022229F6F|nr:protein SLX4IP isoform X2 [Myxocyprinus asiaticus]XP_051507930.1 protein SLX4IP isoform X2 [Myxocyprinus asiaticus]